jgi:DNA-binding NarL/FixJ family response regulator
MERERRASDRPGVDPDGWIAGVSIRVLLVDDQQLIRMGFRLIIDDTEDMTVVGESEDGASAVEQAAALQPDVILLDIRMPNVDGLEANRRILAANPDARIIVVTTFDLDQYAYTALRDGASGFLLKDTPVDELLGAIRAVADGHAVVAPRITRLLLDAFATQIRPGDGPAATPPPQLTHRELEVLRLVAAGMSNAEIAGALFVAEVTVKTHVSSILLKLQLRNRVAVVIYAHEHGLLR